MAVVDVEEEMVDDELQSRNEMIDDVSSKSGIGNAETPPSNLQYSGVQYIGDNIDLKILYQLMEHSLPCYGHD